MDLTSDEVRHIARLARIKLSEAEVERFRKDLATILEHCQALSAIDTTDVTPTTQSFSLVNVERSDKPQSSEDREDILANAPHRKDEYIRVRAVLD